MLVPVVVRPAEGDAAVGGSKFELVAGFHRVAAAAELRLREIPVVIREANTEAAADRAVENITRKPLDASEPGTMALDATLGRRVIAIAAG